MNITKEDAGNLNAVIRMKIEKSDYEGRVDEVLKDYRRKARVDGFRPGMVPMGLVKKMYYKPVLVDEVNKLISESLYNYIREEDIKILGEPLPHKDEDRKIDFDTDTEFEFSFDVGLAPELEMQVTAKDKIPYYKIKVDKKDMESYRENMQRQYGAFKPVERAGDSELIKGDLVQVDDEQNIIENGIFTEGISMSLDMMKDEDQKKLFKGVQAGEEVIFDVKKAYPSDAEVASLLRIEKEKVAALAGKFKCRISEIQMFEKAELNQELYDRIYGEGIIQNEKEFDDRIREEIAGNYENESEYRFLIDARSALIKKAKIDLPVDFLKRWMLETNENITTDQVEEDFEKYEDDFRWQLIKEYLIDQQDIKVSQDEVLQMAKAVTLGQYMQYGISNVPDDYLTNYAKELLEKPEEARKIYDRKAEEKLLGYIKGVAKIEDKEISTDKFRKLFEND